MEHEKLSYVEALKWLANKYNIDVEETETSPEQKLQQQTSESLFIINNFAQQFFSTQLWDTEPGQTIGLSYLKERGFNDDVIRKFGLGYAPDSRDMFTNVATAQQYNPELLQKSGLVVERYGQLADNYRDRIVFPIHNHSGKVIGFGARLIKSNDKAPKYINTPENELYVKSRVLYGSYFARQAIDKANECLLVEGYTDVISLHQAGIENVVASGGTALTVDQLRLIKKYSSNLTIVYDGDAAGVKAALRGLDLALEESLNVQLVLIPDKEDPDSYVRKIGSSAFKKFVADNKKDFILFQIDVSLTDAGSDPKKKSEVVNQIAETISRIDKTEDFTRQQDYIRQCSQLLKIDEAGFTALVNKHIRNRLVKSEKLPFDEAKVQEENARRGEDSNFDDNTFELIYKDELQEREIARILLEYGSRKWQDSQLVAEFVLNELPEDDLIQNQTVLQLIQEYKRHLGSHDALDKNFFVYHPDNQLSTFAVSLLHFPYEQSERWRKDMAQSIGYQKQLFEKDFKTFMNTIHEDNGDELSRYLKTEEDRTHEEVISAVNYLKLRKLKRMLTQVQTEMEKASPDEQMILFQMHQELKQMEMKITSQMGTVILK